MTSGGEGAAGLAGFWGTKGSGGFKRIADGINALIDFGKGINGPRELAKVQVFATRTASEHKEIYGWGNGEAGVRAARETLDAAAMARIQGSVTKAEVEATRNLYRVAAAAGRGGAVAPQRAAYMEEILKLWK